MAGLGISLFLVSTTALSQPVFAQSEGEFAFDFESFSARMKDLATAPHQPVSVTMPEAFQNLDYDAYRLIQYRPDASKWSEDGAGYRLQAFHPGWLYTEPVKVFEVEGSTARPVDFRASDFQ